MTEPSYTARNLLGARDSRCRRCWFCGSWAYGADDCPGCTASAQRPENFNNHHLTHKESA